jgi:ABC-type cobalamin/Fe3+-siderophores transport system ATPase subunit
MVLAQGNIEAFGKIGDILTEEILKKVYGVDFEVSKDKRGVPFVRWGKIVAKRL